MGSTHPAIHVLNRNRGGEFEADHDIHRSDGEVIKPLVFAYGDKVPSR